MVSYLIIFYCFIISISCQQIDELVECTNKDLSQYQFDKMNINEQEQLVNIILFYISEPYRAVFQYICSNNESIFNRNIHVK
jgi:hypothetical protein